MQSYITNSSKGAQEVIVDPGDFVANLLRQRETTGGVTDRALSVTEVRSKLRDEGNLNNNLFIQSQINAGTLSANYANTAPPNVGRTTSGQPTPSRGTQRLGHGGISNTLGRYQPARGQQKFAPDPQYVITSETRVNGGTMLARGISVSRYLGAEGDRGSLNHIPDLNKRRILARNLQPNAEALRSIITNQGKFKDHRLRVVEGVYKPGPLEAVTPGSINDFAAQGRVAVYELVDLQGNIDNELTYDLAVYWKDHILFDKLILDYDTYDPSGELNTQLIVIMPEMDEMYSASFKQEVQTRYNNSIQSENELIEITTEQQTGPS
jgi:hypothetical protein